MREALRVRGLGCAPMSLSVALWLSERSSLCVSARGLCVCKRLCPALWLYVPWLCPGECVRAMSVLGRHCGDNDGESWSLRSAFSSVRPGATKPRDTTGCPGGALLEGE